jgi:hypothetical protein
MNISIELHDSCVSDVARGSGTVTVRFAPAYVHKSEGCPGVDPGTGWIQDAALVVDEGALRGTIPDLPCDISDGELKVGDQLHPNAIPLPLDTVEALELKILFVSGDAVVISGRGARLELLGESKYVEDFS